jgi:branched-chain amino acid transport system ATP-binding protein
MCLEATGVVAAYGDMQVLWGVDVSVAPGKTAVLLGSNGAGKSTFLRTVVGLLPVGGGEISLFGEPVTEVPAAQRAKAGIAYMSESGVFAELSVHDNLLIGVRRLPRRRAAARLAEMYDAFPEIADRRKARAGSLSGGQRKLVAVAKALVGQPRLVVMDEPSAGLSPRYVSELVAVLGQLGRSGELALLLAEQNVQFLDIADHAFVIEGGRTTFSGTSSEFSHDETLRRAFFGLE